MNRMFVLLRKDLREILKSRTTYTYLLVPAFLSLTYLSTASSILNSLSKQGVTNEILREAAQSTMNGIFYSLPLIVIMLICSVLASYAVVLDKTKRSIESLLATPLSLRQVWVAKSLAVTIPSSIIGLAVSIIMVVVINVVVFIPRVGVVIPDPLSLVTGVILVPLVTFFVVSIVTCLQLIITNPRLASLIFSILFLLVFFSTSVSQIGLNLNYSVIYIIVIVFMTIVNFYLSRFLTKERIVLSSKV